MCGTQNFHFSQKDVSCGSETSQMENITYGGILSPQVQFPAYRRSLRSQRKHKMSPPDLSSLRESWAWQLTLEDQRFSKSSPNSRLELKISNSTYLIQHQEMPIKSSFKSVSTYTKTKNSFFHIFIIRKWVTAKWVRNAGPSEKFGL